VAARVDARQRALFAPPGDDDAAAIEKLRTMAVKLAADLWEIAR